MGTTRINNHGSTPLLQDWLGDDKAKRHRREIHFPSGRFGEAIEQAQAVVFLASDESSFVNATDFVVDGGLTKVCGSLLPGGVQWWSLERHLEYSNILFATARTALHSRNCQLDHTSGLEHVSRTCTVDHFIGLCDT